MTRPAGPALDPEVLDRELAERRCEALLIVATSARDPDLAPFVGRVHLGSAFLLLPRPGAPSGGLSERRSGGFLGYLSPMERQEAARTGFALLTPEDLELRRFQEDNPAPGAYWGPVLRRGLELAGVPPGRFALAGHLGAGHAAAFVPVLEAAGRPSVDGHEVVRLLRKRKGPEQVAGIRRAAAGTTDAFRRVAEVLAHAVRGSGAAEGTLLVEGEPLTVGRLRGEVFRVLADHGLEQPEGNIVAPAEEGAVPHSVGTDERVLRAGESLVVDLFPRADLFADCTRTFCVGRPPEALAVAHGAVRDALQRARRSLRPGVRGWSLQEEVCEGFQALGHATPMSDPRAEEEGYVHNLGHGVGYELHEYPSFRREAEDSEALLAAGDVVTLEPGLYSPSQGWGVRLEDLLVVGDDGIAEDLTPLPYDLDPRAW